MENKFQVVIIQSVVFLNSAAYFYHPRIQYNKIVHHIVSYEFFGGKNRPLILKCNNSILTPLWKQK